VTWYAKQAQFEFLDTAGTSHIAASVSIRSVDGRAKRWWNHESGFVYRTSGLEQSVGTQNG
jgi:hypothetical protein